MSPVARSIVFVLSFVLAACAAPERHAKPVTITVIGTNDVHGELVAKPDRGGLVTLSAYVAALRAARAADGGAVVLVDAGDMWQGTLESNLQEGADVVAAYNALGYKAAAIGNHEFDFGPVGDTSVPVSPGDDPRGALRQRAREATFPLLAANLIDDGTGKRVAWDNVQGSTLVDAAGIRVGIVGVLTEHALATTIAANTTGLSVAPLAPAIVREARGLRAAGADLVIVVAHAGGRCADFDDPHDTSSCNMRGEILRVASALPTGLVDHIVAGHVHDTIAHFVNGIAITASYAKTRAFSRVDFSLDPHSGDVLSVNIHPPQELVPASTYASRALVPQAEVVRIAEAAATRALARKQESLGVELSGPFELLPDVESALANVMTEALLDSIDADVAIHNVIGGIRAGLPAGELTYGAVYEMFPFDNVVSVHELTGAELRRIVAHQVRRYRRAGFAGLRVFVDCAGDRMDVVLRLDDGRELRDDDRVRVIANDFLALGGDDILTPAMPSDGFRIEPGMPRTRDVLVSWFRNRAGTLDPAAFRSHDAPKWNLPDIIPPTCTL